jgi:uncharacterized protein (TIRG00374 family)
MKLDFRAVLGIVLSAALLVWTLRGIHLAEVWQVLRASNLLYFAAATVAATLTFPLRARRWRTILDPVAPNVPFGPLWRATAIGVMISNVVPARAGELARAFALTREESRVPFAASFASLAVDRLFDAVILLLLMFLAMFAPDFPADRQVLGQPVTQIATGGVVLVVALMFFLYLIVFFPARIISLYELVARRVSPRLEARGRDILQSFAAGLGVLRSPRRFAAVFGWTLAHWLLHAFAFWLGVRAVGLEAPFTTMLFFQGLVAIAVAIPAAPGFFGVFEKAAEIGLSDLYGYDRTTVVSWAIGYHLLTFVPITAIGAYYFTRLGLRFRDVRKAAEPAADAPSEPAAGRA